jgi:DNA-binding PadR family transcriptional regulator
MTHRITTLGYAILGLLNGKPMTGYGVRKVFQTTPMASYSSSPGSIYPALKRLETDALIRRDPAGFAITDAGRAALHAWVTGPVSPAGLERGLEILSLRFAFMDGVATRAETLAFLETLIAALEAYLPYLEAQEARRIAPLCGRLAIEGGIESLRLHLAWARGAHEAVANAPGWPDFGASAKGKMQ